MAPQTPRGAGARSAAEDLRSSVTRHCAQIQEAGNGVSSTLEKIEAAADLDDTLRLAASLVLLLADLETAAKAATGAVRDALAEVMAETGCPFVDLPFHVVASGNAPGAVIITDVAAIPEAMMRQPPPAPDKILIGKLLRAGRHVPGAELGNKGRPIVAFHSRRASK